MVPRREIKQMLDRGMLSNLLKVEDKIAPFYEMQAKLQALDSITEKLSKLDTVASEVEVAGPTTNNIVQKIMIRDSFNSAPPSNLDPKKMQEFEKKVYSIFNHQASSIAVQKE